MTDKLQYSAQMFECCIRADVHIKAQKIYEQWYAGHIKSEVCAHSPHRIFENIKCVICKADIEPKWIAVESEST